ncbi:MAG TPA: sulfite exporter TauE/SafE family protein [Geminicoccaceae bacterium]|nr:sulfite exporter TauE/SafE family protein [Geminicoccaceae bacterium]
MSWSDLPLIAAIFVLAGTVKGVTGLGLPTVAMGLLGLTMPPAQAAALIAVPSLVTNVWQMAGGPSLVPLLRRLWPMQAGVCIGTLAGGGLLAAGDADLATAALGLALAAYAAIGLSPFRLPVISAGTEAWLGPVAGAVTGLITSVTGVFVIPAVPYLQALRLDRDELIQALGLSFTVSTLALSASLLGIGVLDGRTAAGSLLALAGMAAGQWLRRTVSPETFRRCFFLGLLVLGLHLAARGLA